MKFKCNAEITSVRFKCADSNKNRRILSLDCSPLCLETTLSVMDIHVHTPIHMHAYTCTNVKIYVELHLRSLSKP